MGDGKGIPQGIPSGALYVGHFYPFDRLWDGGVIGGAVGQQIQLPVVDTEILEGTGALSPDANNLLHGVIRRAGEGEQHIPGPQHPKQGGGEGMGAGHKVVADQGILRPDDLGKDRV